MAKNVKLAGAIFPDVPSVRLPDENDVFHNFTDVSDTTATAADVAQGKLFFDASGALTEGTASGGGGDNSDFIAVIQRTITELSIPNGCTKIGTRAFQGCTALTTVTVPEGVTDVSSYAFNGCTALRTIDFPSTLTSIGGSAFNNCSAVYTMIVRAATPPSVVQSTLNPMTNVIIYVPAASVDAYKAATGWSSKAGRIYPLS